VRYGIPVSGGVLDPHFGHCQEFAFVDADEATKEILKVEIIPSPGHQPGFLPGWMAEQGASVIIAGGMGPRAQELFQQNRIQVIIGAPSEPPDKVVLDYLAGALITGDNACDH